MGVRHIEKAKVREMFRFRGFAYGPGPGMGIVFFLLFILFVAAVLWFVLASTHRGRPPYPHDHHGPHPGHHGGPNSDALAILDRRFANGEIDEDEYVRRRKLLSGES